jgi:hypothetical protein
MGLVGASGARLLARLVIEYGVILFDVGVNARVVDVTVKRSDMDVANFILRCCAFGLFWQVVGIFCSSLSVFYFYVVFVVF